MITPGVRTSEGDGYILIWMLLYKNVTFVKKIH
jgi:hypothetical protein